MSYNFDTSFLFNLLHLHRFETMMSMYYDMLFAVLEKLPDKTCADTRAICAAYIDHGDMGICTSIDSEWSIQTPTGFNAT